MISVIYTWFTTAVVGKFLSVFFVSMLPIIELRGGVPIGLEVLKLQPMYLVYIAAIIGNLLPIPFIIFFIEDILNWLKKKENFLGKFARWLESRAMKRSGRVEKAEFWGLCLFVGIPLPGTGAWTGALIASLLKMDVKKAFLAIILGVLIAAVIMTVVTFLAASGISGILSMFS